MTAKIVKILEKTVNRHGVECRIGITADYIDETGVFRKGQLVYTENPDLFEKFVIGLEVAL